ncbi:MAG TPA: aldose epimerase family protein [Chthoniobacterales bacterium]|jgi:aldose 1-epimerase
MPASRPFGFLPTGEPVELYTLANANGMSVSILNLGGIVTALRVPDRHGEYADVVLGFDNFASYLAPHPYFGAIAGRVAGRITDAVFMLDGETYSLPRNNPPNHLHGGVRGFDKHLWSASPSTHPNGDESLRLSRVSPDGEEGYPGNVSVAVTYTLTSSNALMLETEATTDRSTPFSLTQHSYFNLAGEGSGSAENHVLQIHAEAYAPTNGQMTLLGRRESVTDANDFRQPRRIGEVIPGLHQGHGDLYFLPGDGLHEIASLTDPASGRRLTVSTTEACLQFYTGRFLNGTLVGKSGRAYGPHAGLCLECEGYPDGANTPSLGDIILRPGKTLRQTTIYAFSNV